MADDEKGYVFRGSVGEEQLSNLLSELFDEMASSATNLDERSARYAPYRLTVKGQKYFIERKILAGFDLFSASGRHCRPAIRHWQEPLCIFG